MPSELALLTVHDGKAIVPHFASARLHGMSLKLRVQKPYCLRAVLQGRAHRFIRANRRVRSLLEDQRMDRRDELCRRPHDIAVGPVLRMRRWVPRADEAPHVDRDISSDCLCV